MTEQPSKRNIEIGHDTSGSLLITGDHNSVTIYLDRDYQEPQSEQLQVMEKSQKLSANPYKSLTSFKEKDATRYFGREREITQIWQKFRDIYELTHGPESVPRILPVLGPSGCGKSSLIRAGVIPELARQPWPSKEHIRVAVISPGAHPTETLVRALLRAQAQNTNDFLDKLSLANIRQEIKEIETPNKQGIYDGIRLFVDLIPHIQDSPLVLVIDQFEELYSLCKSTDERQIFLENLFVAASDPNRHLSIIF